MNYETQLISINLIWVIYVGSSFHFFKLTTSIWKNLSRGIRKFKKKLPIFRVIVESDVCKKR